MSSIFKITSKKKQFSGECVSWNPAAGTLTVILGFLIFFCIWGGGESHAHEWTPPGSNSYEFEQAILPSPILAYTQLSERLHREGPNASFPEFAPLLAEIQSAFLDMEVKAAIDGDQRLLDEFSRLQDMISGLTEGGAKRQNMAAPVVVESGLGGNFRPELNSVLMLDLFGDGVAFHKNSDGQFVEGNGPFPYRPTILMIAFAMGLLDRIERKIKPVYLGFYQFEHYEYVLHRLTTDPEMVLIPSTIELSALDLIQLRAVPLGLVRLQFGLNRKRFRPDYYSPLDFWKSEINRLRRMSESLADFHRRSHNLSLESRLSSYREKSLFIRQQLMPLMIAPRWGRYSSSSAQWQENEGEAGVEDRAAAIRQVTVALFYEILWEFGVPADLDAVLELIRHIPKPHLGRGDHIPKPPLGRVDPERQVIFDTTAASFLAKIFRDWRQGVYDAQSPSFLGEESVPEVDRSVEVLVDAVFAIFKKLRTHESLSPFTTGALSLVARIAGVEIEEREILTQLSSTRLNAIVLRQARDFGLAESGKDTRLMLGPKSADPYAKYAGVGGNPSSILEYLSMDSGPLELAGIAQGKTVVLILGYFGDGYKQPRAARSAYSRLLDRLDPKRHIVVSLANPRGIGEWVFAAAKVKNFETVGLMPVENFVHAPRLPKGIDHLGFFPSGRDVLKFLTTSVDFLIVIGGGPGVGLVMREFFRLGKPMQFQPSAGGAVSRMKMGSANSGEVKVSPGLVISDAETVWKELVKTGAGCSALVLGLPRPLRPN